MFNYRGMGRSLCILAALVLLLPQASIGEDRDTQEVQRYVLTEAALAKYKVATARLAALPRDTAAACDEESSTTIAAGVARIDATPGAKAAIAAAGMTTREYVVFTWSLLHNGLAAWATSQPGGKLPAGTNPANVAFYKKHAAEIEALSASSKDDCSDESAADDSE